MRRKSTANARTYFALVAVALLGCGPSTPTSRSTGPGPVGPQDPGSQPDAGVDAAVSDPEPPQPAGLGRSNAEAIQVCKPSGQSAYLSRLRCADGSAPSFQRVGHSGYRTKRTGPDDYKRSADQVRTGRALEADEPDFHPVDQFTVVCRDEDVVHKLYLDMYHCAQGEATTDTPDGFAQP